MPRLTLGKASTSTTRRPAGAALRSGGATARASSPATGCSGDGLGSVTGIRRSGPVAESAIPQAGAPSKPRR